MACSSCSRIRCKLYGVVAGVQSLYSYKPPSSCSSCGGGRCGHLCATYTTDEGDFIKYNEFGADWATFVPYLKTLWRGFRARFNK